MTAAAVQTLQYPSSRPTGVQNLVGGIALVEQAKLPVNYTTGNAGILVGDIIVDGGAFGGNGVPGNITGNAAPGVGVYANLSGNGVSATALVYNASSNVLATTNNAGNTATSAANLQELVHDLFYGISLTYRDPLQTTSGTVRDYVEVATQGTVAYTLVGNAIGTPGTGNGSVLDGTGFGGAGGSYNVGQLVAVACYQVSGTIGSNAGNNAAIAVDYNNLPCVEVVPVTNTANFAKYAIGYVAKPVASTDSQVYVNFQGSVFGGVQNIQY